MLYFHHTAGDDLAVAVTAEHVPQKRQCRGAQDESAVSSYRPANRAAEPLFAKISSCECSISRPWNSWNCVKVPLGGQRANRKLQMVPIGGPGRCNGCLGVAQ